MDALKVVLANWKTSVAGLACLAITIAFLFGRLTVEQYMATLGMLAAGGFALSGDGQKK